MWTLIALDFESILEDAKRRAVRETGYVTKINCNFRPVNIRISKASDLLSVIEKTTSGPWI